MDETQTVFIALFAGILPSLLWLGFWLCEDRCEPEPKIRLSLTFLAGMVSVALVLPLEQYIQSLVPGGMTSLEPPFIILVSWAVLEEVFKFSAAAIFGLTSKAYDEPVDAIVYMITAALGFAAAENALFLCRPLTNFICQPLTNYSLIQTAAVTGDLRFVGSTLLHTLASATIGLSMAFAFYSSRNIRRLAVIGGVILAIVLHTLFNFFILPEGGAQTLSVFLSTWAGIVAVLFLIERIKHPARDYC